MVEADGQHHFTKDGLEYDQEKDAYLRGLELTVLRFSNDEINKNIDGVLKVIRDCCI